MDNISYEDWVFPGLVMIINTIIIAPIIFRDFYYSRLESKTLVTLSLTPLSKFQIISYLLISATVEGVVRSLLRFFIFGVHPLPPSSQELRQLFELDDLQLPERFQGRCNGRQERKSSIRNLLLGVLSHAIVKETPA